MGLVVRAATTVAVGEPAVRRRRAAIVPVVRAVGRALARHTAGVPETEEYRLQFTPSVAEWQRGMSAWSVA